MSHSPAIADSLGRRVDYLRVSVTDRCNERCAYCLPPDFKAWRPREEILSYEEIAEVARIAAFLGVRHLRLTGGEPLVRRNLPQLVQLLAGIDGIESLSMTTNATLLAPQARELRQAGLQRLNVSLDSLDPDAYHALTGGHLADALAGLEAAREAGFANIKLNTVLMRGRNEDQLLALAEFAAKHDYALRFIELMPVSLTDMLDASNFLPLGEARGILERDDELIPLATGAPAGNGPAAYYRLRQRGTVIGLIGAMTNLHFCDQCNKMRLTCEGQLRPCLGNHLETSLKPALRPVIDRKQLEQLIRRTLWIKPAEHVFRDNYQPDRVMTAIGG